MYKLLLVTDRDEVLRAFDEVHNWEYNGFRKPHVRSDVAGALEGLEAHHVDGIAMALAPAEERKLVDLLQERYPLLPIFEAGKTPGEVAEYLTELQALLNKVRADFSSDDFDEREMMIRSRRHFFRKLVSGGPMTQAQVYRQMRLLRSRMDPDQPCMVLNLAQSALENDRLVGRWQDSDHLLERTLFQSFGGDAQGFHVLPLVTSEGEIVVLAVPLRGEKNAASSMDMTAMLNQCVTEGIQHAEEYQGLHLRITGIEVLPSLYALCSDYTGA